VNPTTEDDDENEDDGAASALILWELKDPAFFGWLLDTRLAMPDTEAVRALYQNISDAEHAEE
jgi:hypothetical protein